MKVVLISGKAGHGKDTFAGFLKDAMERDEKRATIIHYADLLKFICKQFFGWNGEKDEAGRTLLQQIGTDTIRSKDPDYWVRFVADMIGFFSDHWDYVIVPDTRFPNEVTYIKERFDAVHVKIVREGYENGLTDAQKTHPSETALDNILPDYTILNHTEDLDTLEHTAISFYEKELKERSEPCRNIRFFTSLTGITGTKT